MNEDERFVFGKHEARLDAIAEDVRDIKHTLERTLGAYEKTLSAYERRLQRLERWRAGLAAMLSVLLSYLGLDRLFHR